MLDKYEKFVDQAIRQAKGQIVQLYILGFRTEEASWMRGELSSGLLKTTTTWLTEYLQGQGQTLI